jgi:ribosomal protein L11 methyltransferase
VIRLAIRCRPEQAERVLAELLELVPGGVEEVGLISNLGDPGREAEEAPGLYEFAVYGPPGELPAVPEFEAAAGDGLVEISSTEIPDDWADRWRDFHKPVVVSDGRMVVRPSWEEAAGAAADVDIEIDPGQAFGTGGHHTTRLCLEFLLELADGGEANGPLVDLGTGSGVLAIAAATLGWSPVSGYDSEEASIEAATANAGINGVELELKRLNLREQPVPVVATVVANLTAPLLETVADRLESAPRTLVCSGLLAGEIERVTEAMARAGLGVESERRGGDWAALLCRKR